MKFFALLLIACSFFASAEDKSALHFGVISAESKDKLQQSWMPFLNDMSRQTGIKIEPFFGSDYASIIKGMQTGAVDLAWFGNKSAMAAVDTADGSVFAQTLDTKGSKGYWSLLVTHKDSGLNTIKDVIEQKANLTLGLGDVNSTSGYLVPVYYVFEKQNMKVANFKQVIHANHGQNLQAVVSKQVDLATNNSQVLSRFKKASPRDAKQIKVIWTSPMIPSEPLVWRNALDDQKKRKLMSFFMNYAKKNPAEKTILAKLSWSGFEPANNDHLLPIRQLAAYKSLIKLRTDDKLSASEKAKQLRANLELLKQLREQAKSVKKP